MWSITAILLKEIPDAVNHQGIRPATGISAGRGVNPKPGSAFLFCSLKTTICTFGLQVRAIGFVAGTVKYGKLPTGIEPAGTDRSFIQAV